MGDEKPGILHVCAEDVTPFHQCGHEPYAYHKRALLPYGAARGCCASLMELPPGKSSYPYHYHLMGEECFYILSGEGILKTPEGERRVAAGDFLFFPVGEKGAHKLTNDSPAETLRYLDFDTTFPVDVAVYPDSGKVGVYSGDVKQINRKGDSLGYYDGE